ncbi:MAG: bifunctional DNA-formamidopyrimidine glycosylase/DNA-(apurinic or apyrimidinic site) lyase [Candidatus Moranbacteria bacterium]|nr:bifunctional DNA-formamidopyrimidine glycosylase/DNA-(apurinic or apyrimidinic site) lyase [Candidatus Moranbacteria bacterium]
MPELPEVETIVRDLRKKAVGYKIVDFWTDWEKSIKMSLGDFKKKIISQTIEKVERRGKNILVFLGDSWVMLIHLKMTGHLLFKNEKTADNKYFKERVNLYIRHIWYLETGFFDKKAQLEFSDLRKFGKIRLIRINKLGEDLELQKLGVEPLEEKFNIEYFWKLTRDRKRKNIKMLIMDQALIVGVGNIYASEALFEAWINPNRKAGSLTKKEVGKLYQAIVRILERAIELRGTSDSDYRDSKGAPGGFQKVLKVYNRKGQECFRCDGTVERATIGQRGTFWCESCQK